METIRIVLVDLPRMLRDIVVDALSGRADMELVGETDAVGDIGRTASETRAHVVIVPLGSRKDLPRVDGPLYEQPRLKVIGITRDGRDTYLRELRPRTLALGNIGPRELADAIRRSVREEPAEC